MMTKFTSKPHDAIWLQTEGNKATDWEGDELEGVTWCQDKINDSDPKYLLSTPKREASSAMFDALKDHVCSKCADIGWVTDWKATEFSKIECNECQDIRAALGLATTK